MREHKKEKMNEIESNPERERERETERAMKHGLESHVEHDNLKLINTIRSRRIEIGAVFTKAVKKNKQDIKFLQNCPLVTLNSVLSICRISPEISLVISFQRGCSSF